MSCRNSGSKENRITKVVDVCKNSAVRGKLHCTAMGSILINTRKENVYEIEVYTTDGSLISKHSSLKGKYIYKVDEKCSICGLSLVKIFNKKDGTTREIITTELQEFTDE